MKGLTNILGVIGLAFVFYTVATETQFIVTERIVESQKDYTYTREELERIATRFALHYDINPALIRAKITVESRWDPSAISKAGAIGLMQVMPANAKWCGLNVAELFVPEKNIECGVKLFNDDLKAVSGNVVEALYRYNAGPKGVKYPPAESRAHARKVLALFTRDTIA